MQHVIEIAKFRVGRRAFAALRNWIPSWLYECSQRLTLMLQYVIESDDCIWKQKFLNILLTHARKDTQYSNSRPKSIVITVFMVLIYRLTWQNFHEWQTTSKNKNFLYTLFKISHISKSQMVPNFYNF